MSSEQWEVRIHIAVARVAVDLPRSVRTEIFEAIGRLRSNPRGDEARTVAGGDNLYQLFVQNFRIVYQIQEEAKLVNVAAISVALTAD